MMVKDCWKCLLSGWICAPGTTLMGLLDGVVQNTAGWPEPLLESVMLLYCSCVPVKVSWLAVALVAWSHTTARLLQVVALALVLAVATCWLAVVLACLGGGRSVAALMVGTWLVEEALLLMSATLQ